MSKIICGFKYIELQAIKHALISQIGYKKWVNENMPKNEESKGLSERFDIDIKQEEKLLEYIKEKIVNKR